MRRPNVIIFPSIPGAEFEKEVGLCRAERGLKLNWWERWLVRRSFVLSPHSKGIKPLTVTDILNGLVTEVQVAMQSGEEVAFREVLHELVDLHTSLLRTGDFINDAGEHDNYACLIDRDDVFDAKLHDLWTREYRRLLDEAVDRLISNDSYFRNMAYVPGWLISRLISIRPISISVHLLHLSQSLHYRLNRWWAQIQEEQGLYNHGPCEPGVLNAPAIKVYDSAIKAYVGAWESLKDNRFPVRRDAQYAWHEYKQIISLYEKHLEATIYMMFDSVSLGNKEGAEWLCDSLIKWWNTIHIRFDVSRFYIQDQRGITLEILHSSWDEARNVIDLSIAGNDENDATRALWAASIHNYWTDMCCISLYAMVRLGKDCDCEKSLPVQLIVAIGKGNALRSGGDRVGVNWPLQTVEDILIAIYRQYYIDGGYRQGYCNRLNKVVEGISNQERPSMVPGRIYSGWGIDDIDSLRDGQLIVLCLFVKENWSPSVRLLEAIQKWGGQDDDALRSFIQKISQWKTRLNDADFGDYEGIYSCLKKAFGAVDNFIDAATHLVTGIDHIVGQVERFRDEQLKNSPISEDRMKHVAEWCSKSGFSKDTADIPVSLFQNINASKDEYSERSLIFQNMNKGEFVEPPMAQRAGNEEEWFDETVSSHVASSVMADLLRDIQPDIIDVDSHSSYWKQIQSAAELIRRDDGDPILLVASQADPEWLLEWMRGVRDDTVELPAGVRLIRDKKFKDNDYIGSLNDIPVFAAPIGSGSSFLISKSAFSGLTFTEFEEGVFVNVSYEGINDKERLINLKISWRYHLDIGDGYCCQLRYLRNQS